MLSQDVEDWYPFLESPLLRPKLTHTQGTYNGEDIAVKLLHQIPEFEENPFGDEFVNLMSIKHPHIVRLVGYCYEIKYKHVEYKGKLRFSEYRYRVLCFEYLQGGSLDKYLTTCAEGSCNRDWRTHFSIIKDICEGLNFLHEGCGSPILHLDLKPANILLDKNMVAKIADFGLSRLFSGSRTHITKKVIGTLKYMAPEYVRDQLISPKNDVFSLGVVIIEVIAGPRDFNKFWEMDDAKEFIGLVITEWRKWINEMTSLCPSAELQQVERCIEVAIKCVDRERNNRPTVRQIVDILEAETRFLVQLGGLPTKSEVVGGSAGTPRDIEEKPWRLESLTISYLGLVDAFSFTYIDQTGKKQTAGPWGGGYIHDKTETILFGRSEFLEEVSGTHGIHFGNVLVMSLTFVTNVKIYGPFGNPYHQNVPATPFRFRADEDSSIVGFHGSSGTHLYSIGVYTCPSKSSSVRPLPTPGQSLPTPTKSGAEGGTAGIARDIKETPWRLESLTISYLGLVDAFSFSYTDQAGKKQTVGPWGEGYHHDKTEMIRFGPTEFLVEVSGTYGTHFDNVLVMSLTFVTNIRSYGPFGNPRHQNVPATPFRFRADENSSIVGFHGRSGQHLYSIGVYTTAL